MPYALEVLISGTRIFYYAFRDIKLSLTKQTLSCISGSKESFRNFAKSLLHSYILPVLIKILFRLFVFASIDAIIIL